MKCKIVNPVNGQQAVLEDKLLSVLKDQDLVDETYSAIQGEEFQEKFGHWVKEGQEGYDSTKKYMYLMDSGEPELFKRHGQYFFRAHDGSPVFLNRMKFPKMTPSESMEVTDNLVYDFVTGYDRYDLNQEEAVKWSLLKNSIDDSIDALKEQHEGDPEMTARVELIEEYKEDFIRDAKDKITEAGFRWQKEDKKQSDDTDGVDEVTEDKKDQPVNIKDNFETSTIDRAKQNTKLLLSQVKQIELNSDKGPYKRGAFLNRPAFVPFNEVWSTLEPLLADTIGHGDGTVVQDVWGLMREKMEAIKYSKPWVRDLIRTLDSLEKGDRLYKRLEFIQAFNNVRLNFSVTEYNKDNGTYTVINATETNSRATAIRNEWSEKFKQKFVAGDKVHTKGGKELTAIVNELGTAYAEFRKTKHESEMHAAVFGLRKIRPSLKKLGIELKAEDLMTYIQTTNHKQAKQEVSEMFIRISDMLLDLEANPDLKVGGVTETIPGVGSVTKGGEYVSPFNREKSFKVLSRIAGMGFPDMSENTVLMNDGKNIWTYSTPSYLHNKVNSWKASSEKRKEVSMIPFNRNSLWAAELNAMENAEDNDPANMSAEREDISAERADGISLSLAGSFKSKGKSDGVDTKGITKTDAINDNIVKMLNDPNNPIFATTIAADKSTKYEIKGFSLTKTNSNWHKGKGWHIGQNIVDIHIGYLNDEYNRMKQVQAETDAMEDREAEGTIYYHYNIKFDKDGNKDIVEGNGAKSQLFEDFNDKKALAGVIYDGSKVLDNGSVNFTPAQRDAVEPLVRKKLEESLKISAKSMVHNKIIKFDGNGDMIADTLSKKIANQYGKGNIGAMIADYTFNSHISNVEYQKMFSGDPAFYKNTTDMLKRIPGTYTNGLQLVLDKPNDLKLNVAYINGVVAPSKYFDKIAKSLGVKKDDPLMKAYKNVNTTDAQAWITIDRWRFIKEKLGQFGPPQKAAFYKMKQGQALSKKELKLVMQPLKGVYFGMDSAGKPTYLKYSQAVLIPDMVAGTGLQGMLDKMTTNPDGSQIENISDQIHEVITLDGVKVGAEKLSTIHKGTDILKADKIQLNKVTLSNRNWKLQQELPSKGIKEINLGSQIQKTIMSGLKQNLTNESYRMGDRTVTGQHIYDVIAETTRKLVNRGKQNVKDKFDIDENGKINDMGAVYDAIIEDFKGRNADENVIAALEKMMPLEAIPQIGMKAESIFMSIMNKNMMKIQTNGASFIQVSPFGLQEMLDENASSIKILSKEYDRKGLKPPRIENGETKPGQCFVPMAFLNKLLPSGVTIEGKTEKELIDLIDPAALKMIGYRIPNQGMSSNDTLEIVGILPAAMGDSIFAYDALPAKTGSDFDIDKMFAMMPNLEYVDGKLRPVADNKNTKASEQNKLFNAYAAVLNSPATYENMITSIDDPFLKDSITEIVQTEKHEDLLSTNPLVQIDTKFDYMSGKFGVAQTANQLVDHVFNQTQYIRSSDYMGIGDYVGIPNEDGGMDFQTIYDQTMILSGEVLGDVVGGEETGILRTGNQKIETILSAFLNAYVDIAKDPFISAGNHNTVTAGHAFTMIRAGVPLDVVNRFIAQPIFKELVHATKIKEAKTTKALAWKGKVFNDPFDYVLAKYNMKDIGDGHLKGDWFTTETLDKIAEIDLDRMSASDKDMVRAMMSSWKHIEKFKKGLSLEVNASKADTKGATGSVAGLITAKNRVTEMREGTTILGFEDKLTNTTLGAYTDNVIDYSKELINKNPIFVMGTRSGNKLVDDAAESVREDRKRSEAFYREFEKSLLTYTYSEIPGLQMTQKEQKDLMTSLPGKILDAKKDTDNFFIKNLQVSSFKGKTILKVDNRNTPRTFRNYMYREWTALLQGTPEERKLGHDLVRYAYAQSGFQYNMNEFFTYIPHWYLMELGIVDAVNGTVNRLNKSGGIDLKHQFFRHNSDNPQIVPRVAEKNLAEENQKFQSGGVVVEWNTDIHVEQAIIDRTPHRSFPEFINYNGGLYRIHVSQVSTMLPAGVGPIYERTFKLGGDQVEYGGIKENSIIPGNRIPEPAMDDLKKFRNVQGFDTFAAETPDNNIDMFPKVHEEKEITGETEPDVMPEDNGAATADGFESNPNSNPDLDQATLDFLRSQGIDPDQEQRLFGMDKDSVDLFQRKIEYFQSKIDAEVIIDSSVGTSRLLSSSDPRSIKAGKPVIVINPKVAFADTVPHEFAHIFIDLLPGGNENARFRKAIDQLKGSELWGEVASLYPELTQEQLEKEVIATAMGREGADVFSDIENEGSVRAFLNWVFDYIKRKLGLNRDAVKDLVQDMMRVSTDTTGFVSEYDQLQKTEQQKEDRKEISRLADQYEKIIDNLTNLKNKYRPSTKKDKAIQKEQKADSFYSKLEKLHEEVEKLESVNKVHGIVKYVSWADEMISKQEKEFEFYNDKKGGHTKAYKRRKIANIGHKLDVFINLDDIKELINDEYQEGKISASKRRTFVKRINNILEKRDDLRGLLLAASKQEYADMMVEKTTQYIFDAKDAYRKQYKELQPQGITQDEWVDQQYIANSEQHKADARLKFLERAEKIDADVTTFSKLLFNHKNLKSAEIGAVNRLIDAADLATDEFSVAQASRFNDMADKFLSGASTVQSSYDRNKRLIDESAGDGNGFYLIGQYKASFLEEAREARSWADPRVSKEKFADYKAKGDHYTWEVNGKVQKNFFLDKEGKVDGEFFVTVRKNPDGSIEKKSVPLTEAIGNNERMLWERKNTTTVNKVQRPKDQHINKDYAKLTPDETEQLHFLKEKAQLSDELYDGKRSRIAKEYGATYIRLPGIMKSKRDRIIQDKNILGTVKDSIKDMYQVRSDEFEYADTEHVENKDVKRIKADVNNREEFDVATPYRARLNKADQNFDLHSIFLMDVVAAKDHQMKSEITDTMDIMINVMMNRDIGQTKGATQKQAVHAFNMDKLVNLLKSKDELPNDVKALMDIRQQRIYSIKNKGDARAHKIVSTTLRLAGQASLMGNWAAETVNLATGTVNNVVDGLGGDVYTSKDRKKGSLKYGKDLKNIVADAGSNVQGSKTNLFFNVLNVMGDRNYLNNDFQENNRVRSLWDSNNIRIVAHGGEHMIHGKLMYSVMESIKVKNKNNKYIDINGKEVSKENAASIDDMIKFEKNKAGEMVMELDPRVHATSLSNTNGMTRGAAKEKMILDMRSIIKKKVIDLHGVYDPDIQSAAQMEWWGKLLFFLRRWMESTTNRRWRGAATMLKKNEDLRDIDKFYSEDMQQYQEGYYATAVRFLWNVVRPAITSMKLEMVKKGAANLNEMEVANLRKVAAELGTMLVVFLAYAAIGEAGDDDEQLVKLRYVLRRELAELGFYLAPGEAMRIAQTPSASMTYVERVFGLMAQMLSPTEEYQSGRHKGKNKVLKKVVDLIPIAAQTNKEVKSSLKFLQQ